ncbi:hypothetical protein HIM_04067 [Hirsutella minnesotensis 3608]|uniref:Uncharacterized protein n=1 Tax=Hirsutella minnesotensis 3608 TaxID=1043627 RepID=A0A0F7ZLW2_9HYPO|nr:hypothetical protein HIM_04067 [Hirsutella minnesotensis 3608]
MELRATSPAITSFLAETASQCQNSDSVEESDIDRSRCFTTIPIRRHKNYNDAGKVSDQLLEDWRKIIGNRATDNYIGIANKEGGIYDSVCFPEARPERLPVAVWITEFGTILDTILDDEIPAEKCSEKLNLKVDAIFAKAENLQLLNLPPETPMERLVIPILRQILDMD